MLETKRNLFEYLVFLLDKWYREENTETPIRSIGNNFIIFCVSSIFCDQ